MTSYATVVAKRKSRRRIFEGDERSLDQTAILRNSQDSPQQDSPLTLQQKQDLRNTDATNPYRKGHPEESLIITQGRTTPLLPIGMESTIRTVTRPQVASPMKLVLQQAPFKIKISQCEVRPTAPSSQQEVCLIEEDPLLNGIATSATLQEMAGKMVTSLLVRSETGTPIQPTQQSNLRSEIVFRHGTAPEQKKQNAEQPEKQVIEPINQTPLTEPLSKQDAIASKKTNSRNFFGLIDCCYSDCQGEQQLQSLERKAPHLSRSIRIIKLGAAGKKNQLNLTLPLKY